MPRLTAIALLGLAMLASACSIIGGREMARKTRPEALAVQYETDIRPLVLGNLDTFKHTATPAQLAEFRILTNRFGDVLRNGALSARGFELWRALKDLATEFAEYQLAVGQTDLAERDRITRSIEVLDTGIRLL